MNKREFVWNTKFINNIESNGLDCWYTAQKLRSMWKLYKIVPQFPADEKGMITDMEHPEYYILYEGNARSYDPSKDVWGCSNYGDFEEDGHPTLIRVFTDFDKAKKRAVLQYDIIESLCLAYLPDENGKEVEKTFVEKNGGEESLDRPFRLIEYKDFIEDDGQVDGVNAALSKIMYKEKTIGIIDGCLIEMKGILGDGWIISYFPSKETENHVNFVFTNPEREEIRIITLE